MSKEKLTIKDLKKIIADLPDDMQIIFPQTDDSHVVCGFYIVNEVTELSELGEANAICLSSNNIETIYEHLGIKGRMNDTIVEKVLF